jgi:hypothetical protein
MQNAKTHSHAAYGMTNVKPGTVLIRRLVCLHCAFCILHYGTHVSAQSQLLDRVLARVGTNAVTLTDVRAALGLGLVEAKPGTDQQAIALQGAIDRQLLLDEVERFPPPEPTAAAVAAEVAAMKAQAGAGFDALVASTGLDESRLQEVARQTLRIRDYIAQRFGTAAQVTQDEVRQYYDDHPDMFTRDGMRIPFEEAEPAVRQRASTERLDMTIDQWLRDIRMRAEVVIVDSK